MNRDDEIALLESVSGQFFDVAVNPIAGMFCTLLALQVSKGIITKDEAKAVVASSLDLINELPYSHEVLQNGRELLVRIIAAIDRLPNPEKQTP